MPSNRHQEHGPRFVLDSKSAHGTRIFLVRQLSKSSEAAEHHQGRGKFPGTGNWGKEGNREEEYEDCPGFVPRET